ncbi:MAG: RHS repeat-associated core domain-containing protein [Candidatus Woesearchaeota archaeon]
MKKSVIFIILLVIAMPISVLAEEKIYVYGANGLVASKEGDDITYYNQDFLGSNKIVTNEDGEIISKNVQYPFGEDFDEKGSKEGLSNNYKFTGQEEDEDLYYYGARYYDPSISRFISVDPVFSSSVSPYAYVGNNPLKYVDPSGSQDESTNDDWSRIRELYSGGESNQNLQENIFSEAGNDLLGDVNGAYEYPGIIRPLGGYENAQMEMAPAVGISRFGSLGQWFKALRQARYLRGIGGMVKFLMNGGEFSTRLNLQQKNLVESITVSSVVPGDCGYCAIGSAVNSFFGKKETVYTIAQKAGTRLNNYCNGLTTQEMVSILAKNGLKGTTYNVKEHMAIGEALKEAGVLEGGGFIINRIFWSYSHSTFAEFKLGKITMYDSTRSLESGNSILLENSITKGSDIILLKRLE